MRREDLYERQESARRMEAVMLVVTAVSVLAAAFAFLSGGWLLSLGFLILGALAFGLSRVFDLLGELFVSKIESDETKASRASEGTTTKA